MNQYCLKFPGACVYFLAIININISYKTHICPLKTLKYLFLLYYNTNFEYLYYDVEKENKDIPNIGGIKISPI